MKKILAGIISLLYFTFANAIPTVAGELYFVKNSSKDLIKPEIEALIAKQKFNILKSDPYYAISQKNNSDYIIIILQKSSNNYFYYFESNKNKSVNKSILNKLEDMNVIFEQSFNEKYLSVFEGQAQKIISNKEALYTFKEQQTEPIKAQVVQTSNALKGKVAKISKGTPLYVYLQTPVNTASSEINDTVETVLLKDLTYEGHTVAPQGSIVSGKITKARHATYGSMNGRVIIKFDKLITPDGETYNISTEDIDFTVTNDGKLASSAKGILVGALSGLLVGLLIAAFSKNASNLTYSLAGAGIGAGSAAIGSAAQKGVDAEIPVYTELQLVLDKPITVVLSY